MSVEERWEDDACEEDACGWSCIEDVGEEVPSGGDIRERMRWSEMLPRSARPYMYPKWTFPENSRKKPKSRKNRMGPARSESSIICWSIRARGFSTANV